MGLESFNIAIVSEYVEVSKNGESFCVMDKSNIKSYEIKNIFNDKCMKIKDNMYIFNDCVDIFIYELENYLKYIELKGCFSCYNKCIESFYSLFSILNEKEKQKIYILDTEYKFHNREEFDSIIHKHYDLKRELFRRQYGENEIVVSSSNFYNQIKKQNNFINRLIHKLKK